MKSIIYADNAATSRLDDEALSSMLPFLQDNYGNASQPYSFGVYAKKAIKQARQIIAECIGAQSNEIYFTSCGTESDNWAIKQYGNNSKSRLIITSCIEHHAVLNACAAQSENARTVLLPVNKKGEVECSSLRSILEKEASENHSLDNTLVSIMTANNEIGTIQPIKELSNVAHSYGVIFHTDAVQAVGHIRINVNELDVDYLSASAHKFNGPKGIGFLYIRGGLKIKPLIDGGAQEFGLRAGTENVASIVGMATALKNNNRDITPNMLYITELERRLLKRLSDSNIDFIRNGSENHIPGNINLSFNNSDGEMILHRLDLKGICISTGSACDSINSQVSHVIKAIGVNESYAKGTIRISLGKNNTSDEVDYIASEIINVLKEKK